uniref:EB domain-containing protein n=1 Tax=Parastrongyloides trichosuri TaxID=131310 RepID=A0A0N4ZUV9_PARTI
MKFFFATIFALAFSSTVQGDSVSGGRLRRQIGYGIGPVVPSCNPGCIGGATCMRGACACAEPAITYSPVVGCAPVPVPVPAVPVPAPRLIPQAIPGAPCEPGVECTGGSICSLGVCVCPPELVQEGTVCVLRQVYGVVPPPPPPVAIPVASPVLALGAPCAINAGPVAPACAPNSLCYEGSCRCAPQYTQLAGGCILRK